MASRPKQKKKSTPSADNDHILASVSPAIAPASPPNPQIETMIQTCMAHILPTIEDPIRQYMEEFHNQSRQELRSGNLEETCLLPSVPLFQLLLQL